MTLDEFRNGMPKYINNLAKSEYSENTINKYSLALKHFIVFAESNDHCDFICKDCIIEFKEYLTSKYAPNTANLYLIALNKYLRYAGQADLCVKVMKLHSHNSLENCLTVEEYRKMLEAAKSAKNRTVYYVMRALGSTGIRFKGLEYFTVDSITKGSFMATNKGKTRVIVIPPGVCKELMEYCRSIELTTGYIFHVRNQNKPVSEVTVLRWLKAVAVKAGVDAKKAFPHNFRHLFARTYMDIHNNIGELADLLGHTTIETTRIYTRTSLEEKRKKLELLDL